jgi:hypothetical protein
MITNIKKNELFTKKCDEQSYKLTIKLKDLPGVWTCESIFQCNKAISCIKRRKQCTIDENWNSVYGLDYIFMVNESKEIY